MLTLYGTAKSRASRSLLALEELGLPYTHVALGRELRDPASDQRKLLNSLNPNGHVPVLDHDGFLIWESMAINLYLAETFPSPLWPRDASSRGRVYQWSFWAQTEMDRKDWELPRRSGDQDAIARRLAERWRFPPRLACVIGSLGLPRVGARAAPIRDLAAVAGLALFAAQSRTIDLGLVQRHDIQGSKDRIGIGDEALAEIGADVPVIPRPSAVPGRDANPHRLPLVARLLRLAGQARRRIKSTRKMGPPITAVTAPTGGSVPSARKASRAKRSHTTSADAPPRSDAGKSSR